jgi:hypothetical protein
MDTELDHTKLSYRAQRRDFRPTDLLGSGGNKVLT